MANIIYQPILNPVKFQLVEPLAIPQYVSAHMDDWLFKNTIRSFEQPVKYHDRWLNDDSIRLQYISNFTPLTLKLYSCDGVEIYSVPFETKQQDFFRPGYYVRQIELDLATFDPGNYYLRIPEANWIGEPFEIMESEDEANSSLYIEYLNSERYGGVIFDVPFEPSIRVPAILKYKTPASRDTVYSDQDEAEAMLHSVPYRIWNFILGGIGGVPPYLIDKLSRIFGCDTLTIDGRGYTKNEGAAWEPVELDGYPMAGWAIELREKLNRDSLIYEDEVEIIGENNIMAVIDSKGFGLEEDGGDFLEILDVQ